MRENEKRSEYNIPLLFSEKQKDLLTNRGFSIFSLRGVSVSLLKNEGTSFWSVWHNSMPIEGLKSRFSEVAIKADYPFLNHSANLTIFDQLKFVNRYSNELGAEIPNVSAIIGSAADYIDLINLYRSQYNRNLMRRFGGCDYAATVSIYNLHPLFVGESYNDGIVLSYRHGSSRFSDIKILPLIIPQS